LCCTQKFFIPKSRLRKDQNSGITVSFRLYKIPCVNWHLPQLPARFNCGRGRRSDTNREGMGEARRPEVFCDVIIRRDRPLAGMVRLDKHALRVLFFI
jgi:hypothetical protein